jgi:hypothetical protein
VDERKREGGRRGKERASGGEERGEDTESQCDYIFTVV